MADSVEKGLFAATGITIERWEGHARGDIGPSVWTGRALQAESDDLEVIGLALLYPALERNVCVPGHHGYPRASDLILGKALKGQSGHQFKDATARPFLHLLIPARRPRRESRLMLLGSA